MMQTKKKKLIYRTIGVLLALSFMSCCFLGYTFARYVTKGTGNIISGVAKWDINFSYEGGDQTVTGDETISIGKISPSKAEYSSGSTPRSKQITEISVNIKNDGDVAAYIRFDIPGTFKGYGYNTDGSSYDITKVMYPIPAETTEQLPEERPTNAEWAQIFTASIVQSTEGEDGTPTGGVTITSSDGSVSTVTPEGENSPYKGMYSVETGETLTVPIVITWTTDLMTTGTDGHTTPEEAIKAEGYPDSMNVYESDLRDSWIGANIAAIGLTFNWYALQGSEQPGP